MDGKFGEQQIIKWLRSMMNKLGEIFWKIFGKLAFLYFFRNIFFCNRKEMLSSVAVNDPHAQPSVCDT